MGLVFGLAILAATALVGCSTERAGRQPGAVTQIEKIDAGRHATPAATTALPASPAPAAASAPAPDADPDPYGSPLPRLPAPVAPVALSHEHGGDAGTADHLQSVRGLEEAGDFAGALAEARRAAFDRPGEQAPLLEVLRLARLGGARESMKHALSALGKARPGDPEPLLQLARLRLEDGDARSALYDATIALARDPESAEAHHLRGRAELRLGMLEEALADFESAVILDPRHSHAFNNLGYALLLSGAPERAIAPLARAAALAPHLAFVHDNLGIAYQRAGQPQRARAEFSAADALAPGRAAAAPRPAEAAGTGELARSRPEPAGDDEAVDCARDPLQPGPRMTAGSLLLGRQAYEDISCE